MLYVPDENGVMTEFHTWSARKDRMAREKLEKKNKEKEKRYLKRLEKENTQAKEIIKGFLDFENGKTIHIKDTIEQAEQFLKDIKE